MILHIQDILQEHTYAVLFFYIFVEEIGVPMPIPGDALLAFLGIKGSQGDSNFWLILLITCVATLFATTLLYYFSRMVGRPFLLKHEKYLRFVHITSSDIDNLEHYMDRHGTWVLIVARLTPGLRTLATVAGGLLDTSYRKFMSATMTGTVLWTAIYYGIGFFLGRRYEDQIDQLFNNKLLLAGIFAIGLLMWVLLFRLLSPTLKKGRSTVAQHKGPVTHD